MALPIVAVILGMISFRTGVTLGLWVREAQGRPPSPQTRVLRELAYTDAREFVIDMITAQFAVAKLLRQVPALRGVATSILFRNALASLVGTELKTVGGFIPKLPPDVVAWALVTGNEGAELLFRTWDLVEDTIELGSSVAGLASGGVLGAISATVVGVIGARQLYIDAVALGNAFVDFATDRNRTGREISDDYKQSATDFLGPALAIAQSTADGIQGFFTLIGASRLFEPMFDVSATLRGLRPPVVGEFERLPIPLDPGLRETFRPEVPPIPRTFQIPDATDVSRLVKMFPEFLPHLRRAPGLGRRRGAGPTDLAAILQEIKKGR